MPFYEQCTLLQRVSQRSSTEILVRDLFLQRQLAQYCCVNDWCLMCCPAWLQCLQYKTDQAQDVKKVEKLHGKLMRLMVSKESHSGAMETD